MRKQPHEHELALRLTLYGQDAIDLRRMAETLDLSCSFLAKMLLREVLEDDRAAHDEEGRVG